MNVIGDITRLNAKRFPDAIALVTEEDTITFKGLNEKVNRLAHSLIERGVHPQDRVAIFSANSMEWVIIYFALAKCGACVVTLNSRYKEEELTYAVNNSGSRIVFFTADSESTIHAAKKDFMDSPLLISMSREATGNETLAALLKNDNDAEPLIEVNPEWPCSLTYTSGTTGKPKGVLHSHRALIGVWFQQVVEGDVNADEVTMINIPFFHVSAVHCLLGPTFLRGGLVVLTSGGFDPDKILKTVEYHKVTTTMWVPTQLAMLINSPIIDKYDISSLTKIWYGSSPITESVLKACLQRFKADFYQWYGQTEIGISSVLTPKDHYGEKAQFTGREACSADMRIVNENGEDVRVGEVGEIICRQNALGMIGYHAAEEETKRTIRDGWIFTGDLARVEGEGYFTVVDRLKDMIISGAENIYPKEIEEALSQHPGVLEVAVFGIPDDVFGESVCAAIVKRPGSDFGEKEIIDFSVRNLSGYKKPKKVIFFDQLPRNAFGKVTKNILREPFWAGRKKRI